MVSPSMDARWISQLFLSPSADGDASHGVNRLQALGSWVAASGLTLAVFSSDDTIQFATDSFRALFHMQPGAQRFDSVMRHCHAHQVGPRIETDDIDAWLAAAHARRRSVPVRTFEVDFVDGRWLWASETLFNDGWLLLVLVDFTAVKSREFALRHARDAAIVAAETDSLTGVLNRGGIMRRFTALRDASLRSQQGFVIVLIDLDHFKAINDEYGHDAGDVALRHFAACLGRVVRPGDRIGRTGGEEFLLLMPGVETEQACVRLAGLRDALSQQALMMDEVALRYTFSAGVAAWRGQQDCEQLYREADRALYAAKAGGRNQTRVA